MDPEKSVVYGPVHSRRFGWDLGINLLPTNRKLCTFDCIYCQYGFSPPLRNEKQIFPDIAEILNSWEEQIVLASEKGIPIYHTTVSGNGEPTMHPDFNTIIPQIVEWRNQHASHIRLAILSNGYRIHDAAIRETLKYFDEPILKLDSAIPEKLKTIDRPLAPFSLAQFISDLQKCDRIIIQTMFLKGWNDHPRDILCWQNALLQIRPVSVQIYTVSRDTALPELGALSEAELLRIADDTSRLLNVPVQAAI